MATAQPDPIAAFANALERARSSAPFDPTAVSLATVGSGGRPSVRMVLLKGVDERGFQFFTNKQSRKARELAAVPFAALCFYWGHLEEQVRVEGSVEELSEAENDAYFATRPRGSQIGAWASFQSEELDARITLEARAEKLEAFYRGALVPRPPHWGGYVVIPSSIEFWYGRENRLHERHVYEREAPGAPWRHRMLFP